MQIPKDFSMSALSLISPRGREEKMGAETTDPGKWGTLWHLIKVSLTPGSPVAAELMKDEKMATMIKAIRISAGTIAGGAMLLIIMKRRKKKKLQLAQIKKIA